MLNSKWWNNKTSDIKLVYLYSTIKMMHGPISIRFKQVYRQNVIKISVGISPQRMTLPYRQRNLMTHFLKNVTQKQWATRFINPYVYVCGLPGGRRFRLKMVDSPPQSKRSLVAHVDGKIDPWRLCVFGGHLLAIHRNSYCDIPATDGA